jgi:hypothetical protein
MKHLKRCSYTIPESPLEDKWGAMAKAWVNITLFKTKRCLGLKSKIGGTRFEGKGCNWLRATMISSKGIDGIMGWRALAT